MTFPRQSGILLHPTSLPSRFGIGDFGNNAYKFIDFLVAAGQSLWQVLPLGQTGYGDSPYQCLSAFAGNIYLISPEKLASEGLLDKADISDPPDFPVGKVDYGKVIKYKTGLLRKAFENFRNTNDLKLADEFRLFCHNNRLWLDDYALFQAIKFSQEQRSWQDWDECLKHRDPGALSKARQELDIEDFAEKFYQFIFYRQWFALKEYANQRNIGIYGDMPIFVALDSCDVWSNPSQFKLNGDGSPKVVAGVPPDYFSKTGQLWGNPIYDWDRMRNDGFTWWVNRFRQSLAMFDVCRIDHFRGFSATWEVPGSDTTAENGEWVSAPGIDLFNTLKWVFGELPIVAEDLGVITDDVENMLRMFGFPGMKLLQYAFGGDGKNTYLPHNFEPNSCVYTGTHDNETTVGWFKSLSGKKSAQARREKNFCLKYLRSDGSEIHWDFIREALASVANTVIIPMQDLLGLDNKSRMNTPSTESGNWRWRYRKTDLKPKLSKRLRELTELYGRI